MSFFFFFQTLPCHGFVFSALGLFVCACAPVGAFFVAQSKQGTPTRRKRNAFARSPGLFSRTAFARRPNTRAVFFGAAFGVGPRGVCLPPARRRRAIVHRGFGRDERQKVVPADERTSYLARLSAQTKPYTRTTNRTSVGVTSAVCRTGGSVVRCSFTRDPSCRRSLRRLPCISCWGSACSRHGGRFRPRRNTLRAGGPRGHIRSWVFCCCCCRRS